MAMENSDSKSSQKRSWEESESCPTIETVPKDSSNGEDEINTNKKLRVSTESGAGDGTIESSSKTSLQGFETSLFSQSLMASVLLSLTANQMWLTEQSYIYI